jgi:hypothetical protein
MSLLVVPMHGLAQDDAVAARVENPAHAPHGCLCDAASPEIRDLHEQIALATTVEDARELASASTRQARAALERARAIDFFGQTEELGATVDRLAAYEDRVALAPTPQAVAAEFDTLLAKPGAVHADVEVDGPDCNYSTGEIIATVLGFIFGIIPGLILLVLLC